MRAVKGSLVTPLNRGMENRKVVVRRAQLGTNPDHLLRGRYEQAVNWPIVIGGPGNGDGSGGWGGLGVGGGSGNGGPGNGDGSGGNGGSGVGVGLGNDGQGESMVSSPCVLASAGE